MDNLAFEKKLKLMMAVHQLPYFKIEDSQVLEAVYHLFNNSEYYLNYMEDPTYVLYMGVYEDIIKRNYCKAEEKYLAAIDKKILIATEYLHTMYLKIGTYAIPLLYIEKQQYYLAETYFLTHICSGHHTSLFLMASLYYDLHAYDMAEKYYRIAVERGNICAMDNLGHLYYTQGKYLLAESYFLMAMSYGDNHAIYNLARLHANSRRFNSAETYYLLFINKLRNGINFIDENPMYGTAIKELANLFYAQQKYHQAEEYYLISARIGDKDSMKLLGNLYLMQGKNDLSKKYYAMAVDEDDLESLERLISLCHSNEKYSDVTKYLMACNGR